MPIEPKYSLVTVRNILKKSFREIVTVAPIFLTAALVSCGGSSGGGSNNSVPAVTFHSIVTSVPTATYTADNLAISNQIASIRQGAAGTGLLAQNTALDTAAGKHAAFLVDNGLVSNAAYLTATQTGGILGGHYEDSTAAVKTNYTGASPLARATAAGYGGSVVELVTFGAASGTDCIASIENSVYHLIALVSPFVDMGIGFNAGTSGSACAIELGVKSTTLGQLPAAAVSYPDGQTVPPTFYNHAEFPIPAPDLSTAGHPVVVSLYTLTNPSLTASDIVIHAFSITKHGAAATLATVRVLAKTGVTSSGANSPVLVVDDVIPAVGFVVLLPTVPLEANTTYDLSFSATVKGVSVSKNWLFTTGNAN